MRESERTIVSVSFVQGFRAAFYDEWKNEIFYDEVDGFAVTKDTSGKKEVEAFVVDDSKEFNVGLWFPADVGNFLRLVRGSSNFLMLDDPVVVKHLKKTKEGCVPKAESGAVPVAIPGSHKTWLQFDNLPDPKTEAEKEWSPQVKQAAKRAFDQAIREGKSRDDAIDLAHKVGLLAHKQLNTP
jgi:hypothetical protein